MHNRRHESDGVGSAALNLLRSADELIKQRNDESNATFVKRAEESRTIDVSSVLICV